MVDGMFIERMFMSRVMIMKEVGGKIRLGCKITPDRMIVTDD